MAQTHNYVQRTWGHDLSYTVRDGGRFLDAMGWGHGIEAGDYMLLANGDGATRYQVATVSYYADPPDMWQATLEFAPRSLTRRAWPARAGLTQSGG